jgi:nucleotide-binding universal stress UspA family protein
LAVYGARLEGAEPRVLMPDARRSGTCPQRGPVARTDGHSSVAIYAGVMSPQEAELSPRRLVPAGGVAPPFVDILCGIDGSRTAYEAVRQAAILAGPHGSLSLLTVAWPEHAPSHDVISLSPDHAKRAVAKAAAIARRHGVTASVVVEQAQSAADVLLERAGAHDLLVLGRPAMPRAGGIMLGSVASAAVHSAEVPVPCSPGPRRPTSRSRRGSSLPATDRSTLGAWSSFASASPKRLTRA